MLHYSCDSHVVEPREVFEGLEDRFGSRAPRIERDWQGRRLREVWYARELDP